MNEKLFFVETTYVRFIVRAKNSSAVLKFIKDKRIKGRIKVIRKAKLFDAQLKDVKFYRTKQERRKEFIFNS